MLCKYCTNIEFDAAIDHKLGARYHESYADLVRSADAGCKPCAYIVHEHRRTFNRSSEAGSIRCFCDLRLSCMFWKLGEEEYIAYASVWTTDADPFHLIIRRRCVPADASSDELMRRMHSWIRACRSDHEFCLQCVDHLLPTRIIDVGDSETRPSLVEANGRKGRWVALSYCWGQKHPPKTETSTLEAFCRQWPRRKMPRLFRDVISLVKQIGYRYLWIDALCILQDSEKDWLHESADMGRIYKEAALTIIAEAAEDTSIGIFDSTNLGRDQTQIHIRSFSSVLSIEGSLGIGKMRRDNAASRGPLSNRAWALQEGILSSRILRFASGQVWQQCSTIQCNESYPRGHPSKTWTECMWDTKTRFPLTSNPENTIAIRSTSEKESLKAIEFWCACVNAYWSRMITYERDILPAISGIAKEYQKHLMQDYKAGLWSGEMHMGLLWKIPGPNAVRTGRYVAPSWSWASLRLNLGFRFSEDHGLYQDFLLAGQLTKVAEIQSVHVMPSHHDIYGQVSAGILELAPPCTEICSCSVPLSFLDCYPDTNESLPRDDHGYKRPLDDYNLSFHHRNVDNVPLSETFNTLRVTEQECRRDRHVVHDKILLAHVASHRMGGDYPECVFAIILESVPPVADCTSRKDENAQKLEDSQQTEEPWLAHDTTKQAARAGDPDSRRSGQMKRKPEMQERTKITRKASAADKEVLEYRRIGLAILREMRQAPIFWPIRTIKII